MVANHFIAILPLVLHDTQKKQESQVGMSLRLKMHSWLCALARLEKILQCCLQGDEH